MPQNTTIVKPQEGFQEQFVRSNVDFAVGGGVLNSQPITSLIATPNGFVPMRDIKAGDVICNPMGGHQQVNYVIDKGKKPCVEFTLADGRRVESDLEHHWRIQFSDGSIEEIEASEVIKYLDNGKSVCIPLTYPTRGADKEVSLPISPYAFGKVLGGAKVSSEIRSALTKIGMGSIARSKYYVPSEFKYATLEQRIELLRGLLEESAHVISQGSALLMSITVNSPKLQDDIRDMLWAMGAKVVECNISECIAPCAVKSAKIYSKYTIYGSLPFSKSLKKLFSAYGKKKAVEKPRSKCIAILSYKYTGNKECRCINVSGDEHLYLTDNYIITCNCGKAQPMSASVLTPKGWTKMGFLRKGDIISATNNTPQRVERIYERGFLETYTITFDDGRKVRCCPEHLWCVWDRVLRKYSIIEAQVLKRDWGRYVIDLLPPLEFCKFDSQPIHPYLFGVFMVAGLVGEDKDPNITLDIDRKTLQNVLSINDYTVISTDVDRDGCHLTLHSSTLNKELKKLDVFDTHIDSRNVPQEYLYGDINVRRDVLSGILDARGVVIRDGYEWEISTWSKKLFLDISNLVRSLGGKAYTTKSNKIMHEPTRCMKRNYIVRCVFPCASDEPHSKNTSLIVKRMVKTRKQRMRCILVSHPNHLYITDNYTPTHNTFAAVLSVAEPCLDSRFRGLFLRNNLGDAKASGGILDTFNEVYGDEVEIVESGEPRVTFKSGAKIDVTHVADQSRDKVLQRFKGRQYDFIYFDEGTGFTWSCFTAIYSRNRGIAPWTGKVRMTTNPEKRHWLRHFLDWYIGSDGFIREDRAGVVRYFFMSGESVQDVVWGDTKEEVYEQCKSQIDRILAKVNGRTGKSTYRDIIKSFTFYLGKMSENKASLGNNSGYVGSVAVTGGRNAAQLLEGNWNVSPEEELDAPISNSDAMQCFFNDPQTNGDKWVTCDLADTGTDNFLCIAWNGLHAYDAYILTHTTPRQNAEALEMFAAHHDISNSHIIYDAIRGTYINDYIPEAIPFISNHLPIGLYGRMAYNLKAECYLRLVEACRQGYISFDEKFKKMNYEHQNLKTPITFQNEFVEECAVVRFKDMPSGKKALISKKEMNAKLGKNRSMDLLDPCAMRFYPYLNYPYGEELIKTTVLETEYNDTHNAQSIFDETLYG